MATTTHDPLRLCLRCALDALRGKGGPYWGLVEVDVCVGCGGRAAVAIPPRAIDVLIERAGRCADVSVARWSIDDVAAYSGPGAAPCNDVWWVTPDAWFGDRCSTWPGDRCSTWPDRGSWCDDSGAAGLWWSLAAAAGLVALPALWSGRALAAADLCDAVERR